MPLKAWRTVSRRTLLSRLPWMEVGEERVGLPDGREVDGFLWVRTRDFVAMVAVTDSDQVILVRSYKHGPRTVSLAVPAGYIEDGEEPLAAARRELQEETGHVSDHWTSLGSYVVDGNYGVATEHIFLARAARKVSEPASGDLEEMEVVAVPRAEISGYVRRGEVVQLSSAAALAIAEEMLRCELRKLAEQDGAGGGLFSSSARSIGRADRSECRPSSPRSAGADRS